MGLSPKKRHPESTSYASMAARSRKLYTPEIAGAGTKTLQTPNLIDSRVWQDLF